MKKIFMLLLIAGTSFNAAHAQQDKEAMMKAWQAYMTPGDVHKMLARADGTWKTQTTMWMDPSAPPAKSEGTAVNMMVLGGRYQISTHKGDFMGMPFEGQSTLAYDNAKKVFINTWIDNMGSGIMTMEGTWDNAAKTISFSGKATDPMTGKDCNMREVYKIESDNRHSMEMFMTDPASGKEFKTMEMVMTRAGGNKKG